MKSLRYIIFAITLSLLITGCEKESHLQNLPGDWPVFLGYMQFSTDVPTRAALATDMRGKQFGVLGYEYATTTNWATAKPLAVPRTFYNQKVACDASGVCAYDIDSSTDGYQLKPWEDNLYTFFAYHPHDGAGITLSDSNVVNTPTLTYQYGWLDNVANSKTKPIPAYDNNTIFDLMTAEAIDVNGKGSGSVNFEFNHRLFAIEVLANNFNENTEGTTDQRQTISNLKLTIDGLANSAMTIPLSMQEGEADPVYNNTTISATTFQISNVNVVVPAFNETITDETTGETRGGGVASSISRLGSNNGDGYLMFIPQNKEITFTFYWDQLPDIEKNNPDSDIQTSFESSMEFKAGILYQIIINFVGDGITIAIIEAGSWDQHSVYHEFE